MVTPRWERHLGGSSSASARRGRRLHRADGHLRGIPTALRERFGVPFVFYDGDVPMSLPEYGGMDTGFNRYHGADPSEYDLVLSNSEGGRPAARARRAPGRSALLGRRSRVLLSQAGREGGDVFFYGYGTSSGPNGSRRCRRAEPPRPGARFALGGLDFRGDTGARLIGDVPFNVFARAISAARVDLDITRRPHATVPDRPARPFELAAAGGAMVANPHAGIERWFEPGRELSSSRPPRRRVDAYRKLLADQARRGRWARARERVLAEHTYAHRAGELPSSSISQRRSPA